MKKIYFLSILYLNLLNVFGQEKLWLKQTTVSEVFAFEKTLNTNATALKQSVGISKSSYPLSSKYQLTNPLIVFRNSISHLPLYAEYFFTANDSIIRFISYDWERGKFDNLNDKIKIWEEENDKLEIYNSEYERIRILLTRELGICTQTDSSFTIKEYKDRGEFYSRRTTWDNNSFYAELNLAFGFSTYRVRLNFYWKE